MNQSTELVVQQNAPPDSMLSIIERAVTSPEFDVNKLAQLLEMRERWEKNEARKAFAEAMSSFKTEAIRVVRDKTNTQYGSKYVSLGNLVGTVTPFLSKHGLTAKWELDQSSGIKVTCVVTHTAGHFESVSMTCPPDTSGKKNPIQEIKSAITYAKACTFESICGLASTDANVDDDGNGSSNADLLPMDKVEEQCEWIANSRNIDELARLYKAAYKEADAAGDKSAQNRYINAKNKRKAELS